MTKRKFEDATEALGINVTQEISDEAYRLGLNGRQSIVLAIMRNAHGATAPVVVRGKSGRATFTDEGVIEIGGRPQW
jgi:hypothetical protein